MRQTLDGGDPLHIFEDLLEHLAELTAAELQLEVTPEQSVAVVSALTPLQQRAYELGVKPHPALAAELLTAGPAETQSPRACFSRAKLSLERLWEDAAFGI